MNLHEYQAKQILSRYGIPVLPGIVAETADQAADAFRKLAVPMTAVKVQTHAGGRGKGAIYEKDLKTLRIQGGVKLARSADEARDLAGKMLGGTLVTIQTGPKGRVIHKVLVAAGADIARELYLGCVLDRKIGKPVLMASAEGGVEIEEIARTNPSAILRQPFDIAHGLRPFQARLLAWGLGLSGDPFKQFCAMAHAICRMYVERDCSLLEINPLILTKQGQVIALDCKMGIDDRAIELKKQPEVAEMRDVAEEDPIEHEAHTYGLSYVSMDGNIGCMVNGAGLAMSTMDIIQLSGAKPANFLDVGGGANKEQVKKAFKLLLANPAVKAVLINIFGGILRCDVLAQGIVDAVKEIEVRVPIVVRLEGTNVEKGREILASSGLKLTAATDMNDAAQKVKAASGL